MCVLAGYVANLDPSTYHKSILLVGLGHELWLSFPNAQAHWPSCGTYKSMAHLTDDPEKTTDLPMRVLAGLQSPLICSSVSG